MATRRGPRDRLGASRSSSPADRLDQFAESAREARGVDAAALADRLDRLGGLGCQSGDMRLAYGWRAAVVTAALVALTVWLATRLVLTGLFVELVTDDVVSVTGFNLGVTLFATLTLGLVRARRFRLAVHHRLVPARRGFRRRVGRWRRSARQRRRQHVNRARYGCRRRLRTWSRWFHTGRRRRHHRWTVHVSRWRRSVTRWTRRLRTRRRDRRKRGGSRVRRLGRRVRRLPSWSARTLRGWVDRHRHRRSTRSRATVLALLFGR